MSKTNNAKTLCATVECGSMSFECKEGTCVDKNKKCDGSFDCPDKSDEEKCGT